MWYLLLIALRDHLAAQTDLNGVDIQLGDSANYPNTATLVIMRGQGAADDRLRHIRGKQTLVIESWVTATAADAEQSVTDGYQQLAELEAKLTSAVQTFGANGPVGYHIVVKTREFQPDGDQFRPKVASGLAIDIQYTKINP